jgi:hypothetical protein
MSTARNYSRYRGYVKSRPSYVLPYVGIYLKDILVIKEGIFSTPEKFDPPIAITPLTTSGTLNADFVETLGPILTEIYDFQNMLLPFVANAELSPFFSSLPAQDDEALYQLSLKWLPSSLNSPSSSYDVNISVNI